MRQATRIAPRFADTFLGAWPSPGQHSSAQLPDRPVPSSHFESAQSNPHSPQLQPHPHLSHKSRASPPRLCTCSTLHSLLALSLHLLLLLLFLVSVCTGTCVRATSPSPSSSSSTWPPAASPSRSLGRRRRPYRILDFMFATFATLPSSRLRQHFMLITRLIRSVCLASARRAPPCLACVRWRLCIASFNCHLRYWHLTWKWEKFNCIQGAAAVWGKQWVNTGLIIIKP